MAAGLGFLTSGLSSADEIGIEAGVATGDIDDAAAIRGFISSGLSAADEVGIEADVAAEEVAGEAEAEGDHIVLGLANFGLQDTAALVGGRTLPASTDLVGDFNAALSNPSTQFTLSLDGLAGNSVESQILGAAQRGAGGLGNGYTNWEIGQLYQAGRLGSTNLIQGG